MINTNRCIYPFKSPRSQYSMTIVSARVTQPWTLWVN